MTTWDDIHKAKEWGQWPPLELVRWCSWSLKPGDRVLDLGCGAGGCSWFLARQDYDVDAIDSSATAIYRTYDKMVLEGIRNVHTHVMDAANLDFANNTFDGVVDIVCLAHTQVRFKVADEIYRVLRPDGQFISILPSDKNDWLGPWKDVHTSFFSVAAINDIFKSGDRWSKFEIRSHSTDFGYPTTVYHYIVTGVK